MALSNIFKEPRREITETLVGLVVVAPLIVLDVWGAYWLQGLEPQNAPPFAILMALMAVGIMVASIVLSLVMMGIHTAGEKACNWLACRGIFLRPKPRYR